MALPSDAQDRKDTPIASGVLDFFPDALAEVARVSAAGSKQHHPDAPMHWDKSKSTDEADACVRHLMERGTFDTDGMRHSAKAAWRALANLQRELEAVTCEGSASDRKGLQEAFLTAGLTMPTHEGNLHDRVCDCHRGGRDSYDRH